MDLDLLVRLKEKLDEQTHPYDEGISWGLYASITDTFDLGMLTDEQMQVVNAAKLLSEYVWGGDFRDDFVVLNIYKYEDEIELTLEFSLGMYKEQTIFLMALTLGEAYQFLERNPGVWKEYPNSSDFY